MITLELNEREARLLMKGLYERDRAIRRKRSWRLSEKVIALAEVEVLYKKIKGTVSEGESSERH